MKKIKLLIAIVATCTYHVSNAQNQNSSATQNMTFNMANVVSAGFGGNGGSSNVNMPISGINAMADGIESPEIIVTLSCTSDFDVTVSSSSNNFSYSGPSTSNTTMRVEDVLSIKITQNNTGGTIDNGYSQYKAINGATGKMAINTGLRGVSTFGFKYKAQPGFNYPAGTYTTDIIYTVSKK